MREGGGGGEVERARPQGGDADAGFAGEATVRRRHEARSLLVAGNHQLDARVAQRLDHVEVLLAGNAEDALDAFVLERRDEKIRSLCHRLRP